jgi:hypothetical protein
MEVYMYTGKQKRKASSADIPIIQGIFFPIISTSEQTQGVPEQSHMEYMRTYGRQKFGKSI